MWVLVTGGVSQKILEEAHKSMFSIHPGATNMYGDLRLSYCWRCMKREISGYIEQVLTCRKVEAEY